MKIKAIIGARVLGLCLTGNAFGNALQEERSWQFESAVGKQFLLNAELARLKQKNGGFTQVFNISADGASTVYVGNNTTIGNIESQNNITNVANQSNINIEGDGNNVNVDQNNQDSSQNGSVGYAIGSKTGTNFGDVGLQVGVPLSGCISASCNP